MNSTLFVRALCALLLVGAAQGCSHHTATTPIASAKSSPLAPSPIQFAEVAEQAGIRYRWKTPGISPLNILQTIGNGCAFLDYDRDGNLDILLVGPKLALYKGDGHGHFTDVTHKTGLDQLHGNFLGCAVGDYDNDGYDDIYITAYRGGVLLHNEGGKRFKEVTQQAGIKPQPWGTSAAFVDMEGQGRLDLVIGNYVAFGPHTNPQLCRFETILGSCGPKDYMPEFATYYHNQGGGRFRDETREWGLRNTSGKALGIACADYNGSGRQSIALANDEMPGDLLLNLGKTTKNVGAISGTATDTDGHEHGGMGIDWGDYNNDGKLDLVVATFAHEAKCVYRNEDGEVFTECSRILGVADRSLPYIAFGTKFIDADNDGWLDLAFANGHVQDNINLVDRSVTYREPSLVLRNINGQRFEDVTAQAGPAFSKPLVGRGLAIGDYDNDGKMDMLIVDSDGVPLLMHNEAKNSNHWLLCRLEGKRSNRDGLGALVTVEMAGHKLLRRCATDGSYMSASDKRVHFGLGDSAGPVTISVRWPGGKTNVYTNVSVDRIVTLREGTTQAE